jgi:hypothetical protein
MERKENLIRIFSEVKNRREPYVYVFSKNEELTNPTIVYIREFKYLIDLINSYEFRKISYKITSKSKFIWVDIGNYS